MSALDDGSGHAVVYGFSGETKTVAVVRSGDRVSYRLPFDPLWLVFERNALTSTLDGVFVDHSERVKK